MKSDATPSRFIIECDCHSSDHLLVFETYDFIPDESKPDEIKTYSVDAYFTSNYNAPWYTRIKLAIKYIFGEKYRCGWDSVIMTSNNIKQLEELINHLKGQGLSEREENILRVRKKLKEIGFDGDELDLDGRYIFNTIEQLIEKAKNNKSNEL